MNWKEKIENRFEDFSDFIFENRIKVVLAILIIVVGMASQMKYLTVDTSTEGFLHKEDQMRIDYDKFRNQFGRDEKILIAIQSDNIFTIPFLEKLNRLHKELENNLPFITDVNSLINSRNTRGTKDSLIVDDLFEDLPKDEKTLALKKHLAQNNPLLKDLLIDKDGKITTIIIDTQTYTSLDKNGNIIEKEEVEDEFGDNESEVSEKRFTYLISIRSRK